MKESKENTTMNAAEKLEPPIPTTEEILQRMMTENTGRHMLDSGGAYGRNWERNQKVDFDKLPEATLEGEVWSSGSYLNVTMNVYHWLKSRLNYNHELTLDLHAYAYRSENEREGWIQCVEGWAEERQGDGPGRQYLCRVSDDEAIREVSDADDFEEDEDGYVCIDGVDCYVEMRQDDREPVEMAGIYGENDPFWVNSYNHESLLSQIVQFYYWTEGDHHNRTTYVALQVHGGCDARGGYTAAVVFEVEDSEGLSILDHQRGSIGCDSCHRVWDTDDANNWYDQGEGGSGTGLLDHDKLNEFPMVNVKTDEGDEGPREGVIFVGEKGQCHCPGCGTGKLSAWLFPC